jgi:hypothetical protein
MKFSKLLPDLPCSQSYLAAAFQKQHEDYLETFPGWSLQGTRRKLAVFYWLKTVLKHYLVLMITGSMLVLLISRQPAIQSYFWRLTACINYCIWCFIYFPVLANLSTGISSALGQLLGKLQGSATERHSAVQEGTVFYIKPYANSACFNGNGRYRKAFSQYFNCSIICPAIRGIG